MQNSLNEWLARLQNQKLPHIEFKFERTENFLAKIGNPHLNVAPVIHVAGTNGKGSTIAFLHAIMMEAGLLAHRYTSPHLVRFNERIIIANNQVSDAELLSELEAMADDFAQTPLTFFESTTALAFKLFAKNRADFTLLEVGMGGRLDSTNVIPKPLLTVISPISLDHQEFLGETIEQIAYEKAGIIKHSRPCIVGVQSQAALATIQARAIELNAPLFRYGVEWNFEILPDKSMRYYSKSMDLITPPPALIGAHQYQNAALAIACVDYLLQQNEAQISFENIQAGIKNAKWNGRLQQLDCKKLAIQSPIFIDGGHNEAGAKILQTWIKQQTNPVHIIMGLKADKDADAFLQLLAPSAQSLNFVPLPEVEFHAPDKLQKIAQDMGFAANSYPNFMQAIAAIQAPNQTILITGSLYLVGEVLQQYQTASTDKTSGT